MQDDLTIREILDMKKEKEQRPITMIYNYCRIQKQMTWHLLCVGSEIKCLECYLDDMLRSMRPEDK